MGKQHHPIDNSCCKNLKAAKQSASEFQTTRTLKAYKKLLHLYIPYGSFINNIITTTVFIRIKAGLKYMQGLKYMPGSAAE